jgi:hypothetical protein
MVAAGSSRRGSSSTGRSGSEDVSGVLESIDEDGTVGVTVIRELLTRYMSFRR